MKNSTLSVLPCNFSGVTHEVKTHADSQRSVLAGCIIELDSPRGRPRVPSERWRND
jgi:hypothetical protein